MRAEFDYQAQQEEELTFEEGEEMELIENDDPDWYLVKMKNGEIGLAPSNYVADAADATTGGQEEEKLPPIAAPATAAAAAVAVAAVPVVTQPPVQPIKSHPVRFKSMLQFSLSSTLIYFLLSSYIDWCTSRIDFR